MSNINLINKELKQVNNLIRKDIIKERTISNLYKYIFKSSGKQLRAKLCLISSSYNKKISLRRYKLAAVIELLHTATLVHDDVVDESEIRRGTKSVNNIWSNAHGVLIGDYIYSKAFMLMVELGNPKILNELSKATNDISKGELIQLDAIKNTKIKLEKLEDISYFKTGRLFEASAKCGAILANTSNSYQKNITSKKKTSLINKNIQSVQNSEISVAKLEVPIKADSKVLNKIKVNLTVYGYDITNQKGLVLYSLFQTIQEGVFIIDKLTGIAYKRGNRWVREYVINKRIVIEPLINSF